MTDSFEAEILRYLLGEMDAGDRTRFEARLARDLAARVALKSCADALGRFACDSAPAEPMSAADQNLALSAILAATEDALPSGVREATRRNTISWSNTFWPLAAAALLALNLVDFDRPVNGGRPDTWTRGDAGNPAATQWEESVEPFASEPGALRERREIIPEAGSSTLPAASAAPKPMADGADVSRELAKVRADYARLQRASEALRAEYDTIVQHWGERLAFDRTVGRLAAMELVDAESYAMGNRKGLVEVARGILTEPGVVVASDGPIGPGVEPPGASGASARPAPYAWAVFDEREQRGYLNLYNVPGVGREESLQLWVRAVDAAEYRSVGEIPPAFYGGAGSVEYRMPDGAPPAEIMITREPRGAGVVQPSGPTVLRGP